MKDINLQNFPFYKDLEKTSAKFLKQHLKYIEVPKNNILFFQGDICENILFLTSGVIRLYIQSENADEITLYHLKKGEQCIVNTSSTLSQTEAIGSAVTVTNIQGYLLDVKSVKELAHSSDTYQAYLFSIYTLKMSDLAKLINDIKFKNLDERIFDYLKMQNTKTIFTTHEKIANELGSTRVVVSRILKELEKTSKIKLTRGAIEICM